MIESDVIKVKVHRLERAAACGVGDIDDGVFIDALNELLARRAADEGAVVVEYDPAGEAMMGTTLSHHAPIPESIRTILRAMGDGPCSVTILRRSVEKEGE